MIDTNNDVLNIGVSSFVATFHEIDDCEANGLPRLPNSVNIIGRLQDLKNLRHPRLCAYLDAQRNKHERIMIVSEFYRPSLATVLSETPPPSSQSANDNHNLTSELPDIKVIFFQLLEAVNYLHCRRIVHNNINPKNILLTDRNDIKLSEFGLYYMTGCGQEVNFPIGHPNYSCPEVFIEWAKNASKSDIDSENKPLSAPLNTAGIDPRRDIWSIGMVILELLINRNIFQGYLIENIITKLLTALKSKQSFWDYYHIDDFLTGIKESDLTLIPIVKDCLSFDARKRPTASKLLQHPIFQNMDVVDYFDKNNVYDTKSRYREINNLNGNNSIDIDLNLITKSEYHLVQRPPEEVYYYWSLAGGDLESLLREAHIMKQFPSIVTLPLLISNDGREHHSPECNQYSHPDYDDSVVPLPSGRLFDRLKRVSPYIFFPLLDNLETIQKMEDHGQTLPCLTRSEQTGYDSSIIKQPISVKEKDIEYQIRRIVLFSRLLRALPYKYHQFWLEARQDIPPLLRGPIWAALLQVSSGATQLFEFIDMKSLDEKSANQIGVDLPRCHSYDELLVSPTGQEKLRRVLTGWLLTHPQYEYTQGMDSLGAIFLRLNFNNEWLALASLEAFIDKYMYNMFSAGTEPLHEYYAVVQQLMCFHNAQLSTFFNDINVSLTGFTASWIYTMFAHSFPVHKTMQLWDTFLLGNSSFPMFIFLSIIHQLNQQFTFASLCSEDIFTLFSNFPEVNIDRIREDAFRFFCVTPRSLTIRLHDNPRHKSHHELGIRPLPLSELNKSMAPRISGEDLLQIMDYKISTAIKNEQNNSSRGLAGGTSSTTTTTTTSSGTTESPNRLALIPDLLLLDIRPRDEFVRGCLSGSLSVPHKNAFNADGILIQQGVTNSLARCRKHIKVVVNSMDDNDAVAFAERLVRLGINRVCILQGGLDALRHLDRLMLPELG